ncbi:cobyrinate a,c-diamide synthase [Fodinisporobacter ferrooxydans]|uniref:Cobyrinate a,c-diamide synthase n=1 Tax=Fodinisporobacter ferrooxydans TaxID=2901836 RepID=A0ABY4CIE7_9BACL|nr:cobyrinate a,c-diamide synthase [Alicyclobacillaceae bacterium MYW30-H2]
MKRPRIVIAGTNSGAGKTTFTIGLMAALQKTGRVVQGYKAGPDYIDPSYHTAVTGRPSRNLDSWMLSHDVVREIFARSSQDADISVIEGVMGLYDGKDPLSNTGSTAELSVLLQAPVLLVVNVASQARSAAATVLGFQKLDPHVPIAGVLVNRVGSVGHYQIVKAAIEKECGVPVLGYLPKRMDIDIPERHLGLIPSIERGELHPLFDALAAAVAETVDLVKLYEIACQAPPMLAPSARIFVQKPHPAPVRIAVAKDRAFNFYYPENLELLELYGAQLLYFRPLEDESIPEDADGFYIGGGFPEEYAAQLSANTTMLHAIRKRIGEGLPTFAECGGYMFLTNAIVDRAGREHPMVGVIPAVVKMQERLAALGYREVRGMRNSLLLAEGERIRGHEFHYSTIEFPGGIDNACLPYEVSGLRGSKQEGYSKGNLLAGYTHMHFASNPGAVARFIQVCETYRTTR